MKSLEECLHKIQSVSEWNQRALTAGDILTGKEFRRLKRAGKINLFVKH